MTTFDSKRAAGSSVVLASGDPSVRRRDVRVAVLIVLTSAVVVVPRTIQSLIVAKRHIAVSADPTPYAPLAGDAQRVLAYVLIAYCLVILLEAVVDFPTAGAGLAALMLLPWFYLVIRGLYLGQRPNTIVFAYPLLTTAVWVLRPRLANLRLLAFAVAVTVGICVLLALLRPDSAIYHNGAGLVPVEDKQILPFGILIGILTQGNNLGQFIVLGFPALYFLRSRIGRCLTASVMLFALIWTASRGSFYAAGFALLTGAVVPRVPPAARRLVAALACIVPLGLVVALPLVTSDPLAFSNRGFIWQISLQHWHEDEAFGLGARWYSSIADTSSTLGATVYHGHNEFIHLLVTGGWLLLALVALLLVAAIRRAARMSQDGARFAVVWLVAFSGSCLFEISLVLVDNTFLLPVMVLPMAFILFGTDAVGSERDASVPPLNGGVRPRPSAFLEKPR